MAAVVGDMNEEEQRHLRGLAKVVAVQGKFWQEQRRLAAKGMLGEAWTSWMLSNGADPTGARDAVKKVFENTRN